MNDRRHLEGGSNNVLERIRELANEFRQLSRAGSRPHIEDFLARLPESAQDNLFTQILPIEIGFRTRSGESPSSKEYVERFPQFASIVRQTFFEPSIDSSRLDENESVDRDSSMPETIDVPEVNRLGDYELIRELGRGGFGIVYEAKHVHRGHRVALKELPTRGEGQRLNADRLHRFRREFRSLSEFNHPNLVGMQTLEVDGDRWFFTMDLIEGIDFLSYVRPNGDLDEHRLRNAFKKLFEAVSALHQHGIVHRDLKPATS